MKAALLALMSLGMASALHAQTLPVPGADNPRLQTVHYVEGQDVVLTMLPETPLTVILQPDEQITDATLESDAFRVRVSSERDSFVVLPTQGAQTGMLNISTQNRMYRFALRVDQGYAAGIVVRFVGNDGPEPEYASTDEAHTAPTWHYRLRGDREVRPTGIFDNGFKTHITYASGQALPAVFAVGPTGEEEVVNGYMRDDIFVIDRVYSELVFRIDREKATARRNTEPEPLPETRQ